MPKFHCDYCNTYLTHDPPNVRTTHCNGWKHKENVKDYYQKCTEEQAQRLTDKTAAQEVPPSSVLCSSACRGHDPTSPQSPAPPRPGLMPAPHMGGPPMMPMMVPLPPAMMPVGPAPQMRQLMGGHMPMMLGPPRMRPPTHPMMVPT